MDEWLNNSVLPPTWCCSFWLAVQDLKRMPQQDVAQRVQDIWAEFLAEGAPSSINLDSHSYERTSQNLKDPGRYSYEDAQVTKTRLLVIFIPINSISL